MNKFLFILLIMMFFGAPSFAQDLVQDDFIVQVLSEKEITKPETNLNYNYEDLTRIRIPITIKKSIKSENDLYEGQILEFQALKTIRRRGVTIVERGQTITARVETLITNGMNGIPASIVLGDFNIEGLDKNKLTPRYEKFGMDLSLFVFPLKWALTFLPPTGSLTNFILGGHASIRKNKKIDLYYYPNWGREIEEQVQPIEQELPQEQPQQLDQQPEQIEPTMSIVPLEM